MQATHGGERSGPPRPDSAASRERSAADARRGLQVLYACFASFCCAVWIGIPWDFYWHTSRLFDTFYSPPHFVIYGGTGFAALSALYLVGAPRLRGQFGAPLKLPLLPFALPGSLQLLCGGFATVAAAGLLDGSWHTAWGVNETNWSLPHALLAWGIFVAYLGFLSSRLSLARALPMTSASRLSFALLGFAFSLAAIVGPFVLFSTPHEVGAVFARPGFQGQATQGVLAVVREFDLTRANPAYPILIALWVGAGLRIAQSLDPRPKFLLATSALATALYGAISIAFAAYVGSAGDPGAWLPPPIVAVAGAALALQRAGAREKLAWLGAGAVLAALTWALYPPDLPVGLLGVLAVPAILVGREAGAFLVRALEGPTRARISPVLIVMGVVLPILVGAVDLSMRLAAR